jgi:hypothetical protein
MPRKKATTTILYASQKKYRANNQEKIKAINQRYYQKNKERIQAARRARYRSVEKPKSQGVEYHCDECNQSFTTNQYLFIHKFTQKHKDAYKRQFLEVFGTEITDEEVPTF